MQTISIGKLRQKLEGGVVKFSFIKLEGELRPAVGTLDLNIIPDDKLPNGSVIQDNEKVLKYFDLEKENWRSISVTSQIFE